jgi:excisionase family DNA binding protein
MTRKLTYTVEEVGRLLGISRNSAYEAARRGEIPTIRIGRRILVPRSRIEAMINGLDDEPS